MAVSNPEADVGKVLAGNVRHAIGCQGKPEVEYLHVGVNTVHFNVRIQVWKRVMRPGGHYEAAEQQLERALHFLRISSLLLHSRQRVGEGLFGTRGRRTGFCRRCGGCDGFCGRFELESEAHGVARLHYSLADQLSRAGPSEESAERRARGGGRDAPSNAGLRIAQESWRLGWANNKTAQETGVKSATRIDSHNWPEKTLD
eukprot:scaffold7328_cov314-Pinguiococcus_pyrenoidosus.AAC.60